MGKPVKRRILYFVRGISPTDEQREDALQYGEGVVFRNAAFVKEDDKPEDCEMAVGPFVPAQYVKAEEVQPDEERAALPTTPVAVPKPVNKAVAWIGNS